MQDQLQQALGEYQSLIGIAPDRADAARQEIGNLAAKLIADLHACVYGKQPPQMPERGLLCWSGYQLGQLYRKFLPKLPEWLENLEEQLVREGAIELRKYSKLSKDQEGKHSTTDNITDVLINEKQIKQWRQQALMMLLHLGKLHKPSPEWILQAAQELIVVETENVVNSDPSDLNPKEISQLLSWIARLPLPEPKLASVQLAAQRGIWSLQLLEAAPPTAQIKTANKIKQQKIPATFYDFSNPKQLHTSIKLGIADWLANNPPDLKKLILEPVIRPGNKPVIEEDGKLQFNLAALLNFPDVELLDQLLPSYFIPLQEAGRESDFSLAEPHSAIWIELKKQWKADNKISLEQFSGLIYSTALWNRCGGAGGLNAKPMGWHLPIAQFKMGTSLLRPGNIELAALQTVLFEPDRLEEILAEIRRCHHNRNWMQQQSDSWWYKPIDGSENIRRLHTNAGFYASSHAPLESLQRWSQSTLRAILSSPVLFGNNSITEMFWPIAQQLFSRTGKIPELVQWPGEQAFYDFIAGEELLFVSPLAGDVEIHHRTGLAFNLFNDIKIQPYGLRCLEAPMSIYPNRPDRGFEESFERCLIQIDRLYRQKPFTIFTASCGAYGLPLCEAVKQRYGVSCFYIGNLMHAYFGILQRTTIDWRKNSRIKENWITSSALNGIVGIDRIEGGRYMS